MNIHNCHFIGATGLYPIEEIISNTCNNLISYTNITSNNLISYTNTTSNNLISYTNTTSNNLISYTNITSNNIVSYYNNLLNTTLPTNNVSTKKETILGSNYQWDETILEGLNHLSTITQVQDNVITQQVDEKLYRYYYFNNNILKEAVSKTSITTYLNGILPPKYITYYELYKKWFGYVGWNVNTVSASGTGGLDIIGRKLYDANNFSVDTTQIGITSAEINVSIMTYFPYDIDVPTNITLYPYNAMPVIVGKYRGRRCFRILFCVREVSGVKQRFVKVQYIAFNSSSNDDNPPSIPYDDDYRNILPSSYDYVLPSTMTFNEYHYWSFNLVRDRFYIYCDGVLVKDSDILAFVNTTTFKFGITELLVEQSVVQNNSLLTILPYTNDYQKNIFQFSDVYYFKRTLTATEIQSLSRYHMSQLNNTLRVYGTLEVDKIICNSILDYDYTDKKFNKLTYEISQTSNLQKELDGKEPLINLPTNKVVLSNSSGKLTTTYSGATLTYQGLSVSQDTLFNLASDYSENLNPIMTWIGQQFGTDILSWANGFAGLIALGISVVVGFNAMLGIPYAIWVGQHAIPKRTITDYTNSDLSLINTAWNDYSAGQLVISNTYNNSNIIFRRDYQQGFPDNVKNINTGSVKIGNVDNYESGCKFQVIGGNTKISDILTIQKSSTYNNAYIYNTTSRLDLQSGIYNDVGNDCSITATGLNHNYNNNLSISADGLINLQTYDSGTTSFTPKITILNNGNVGIGTSTSITNKLQVNGNIQCTNITSTDLTANTVLITDANKKIVSSSTISSTELGYLDGLTELISTSLGNKQNAITAGTGLSFSGSTLNSTWTTSGTNIYNNNTGNVGIGTATIVSTNKLQVNGTTQTTDLLITGLANPSAVILCDANKKLTSSTQLGVANGGTGKSSYTQNRLLSCISSTTTIDEIQLGTNLSFDTTTTPYKLNATGGTDTRWTTVNTNDIYLTSTAGNVGIGTATIVSTNKLQVNGTTQTTDLIISGLANPSAVILCDANKKLTSSTQLGVANGGTGKSSYTQNRLLSCISSTTTIDEIQLGTNLSFDTTTTPYKLNAAAGSDTRWTTVNTNDIYLTSTVGDVGIGLNNPTYKLQVNGDIYTSNNIILGKGTNTSIGWDGNIAALGRANAAGAYSTSAAINDIVLRSANNLLLQSGSATSAIKINTNNTIILTGKCEICDTVPYATNNNYMARGSLSIGDYLKNYGGLTTGWQTDAQGTAGLLMNCLDYTEIVIHDNNGRLASFMYYNTANNAFEIGRAKGFGISDTFINGKIYMNNTSAGVPTTGTYGANNATKIILYQGATGIYPYALGIDANVLWYCTPATAVHKWYIGATNFMTLFGDGVLACKYFRLDVGAATSLYWNDDATTPSLIGRANTSSDYSTDAVAGDIVIRSRANNVLIQSGTTSAQLKITSTSVKTGALESYGNFYAYADSEFSGYVKMTNGINYRWKMEVKGAEVESPVDECDLQFWILRRSDTTWQLQSYIEDDVSWNRQLNFTGQHRCLPKNQDLYTSNYIGYIVSSTGKYKNINSKYGKHNIKQNIEIDDALPIVELSTSAYDKKVFGVLSLTQDNDGEYKQGTFVSVLPRDDGDARIFCNGCGEGSIWVSDYPNHNAIENGTYLTSSDIAGIAMAQDDDILHSYTVAKITMDCDFEPKLIPIEMIKQQEYEYWGTSNIYDENVVGKYIEVPKLYFGSSNVLDSQGNPVYEYKRDENNEIVYDWEYDMKYIKLDGTYVDRGYYLNNSNVYRMAFVGCSYKCS